MYKIYATLFAFLFSTLSYADIDRKGKMYGYFGWNNIDFETSEIHFKGKDHNFTLHNVTASDAQVPVNANKIATRYLNPASLTIPQYNFRIGYFLTNNFALSVGWDHMKYIMDQNQTVKMTGYINASSSHDFSGTVNNKTLSTDFLAYEHSDGFNTLTLEGESYYSVWTPKKGFDLSLIAGGGAGLVIPKSNVSVLGQERNDEWHLAGVSANFKLGAEMTVWNDFFVRAMLKQGHANMYDVLTTSDGDKATQKITYTEYYGVFSYRF